MRHMLDHAREAVELARRAPPQDSTEERLLSLALSHLVTIVGEAASQVSPEDRGRSRRVGNDPRRFPGLNHRVGAGAARRMSFNG
ncbi:MAG: hypothetical protein K8I02_05465 [Candidatus Methylomirabilis sp.]|nr:hypothetical protein [Deltaproteobacteria bacterium]